MSKSEFDKLITEKFDQHEFAFSPQNWEKLSAELDKGKRRTIPLVPFRTAAVAASLLAVVATATWMFTSDNSGSNTHTVVTNNTPNTSNNNKQISTSREVSEAPAPIMPSSAPEAFAAVSIQKVARQRRTPVQTSVSQQPPVESPVTPSSAVTTVAAEVQPQSGSLTIAPVPGEKIDKVNNPEPQFAPEPVTVHSGGTRIALTGGVNYGSQNTGYMAGINARQKLGNRVFVESDLAVVSNQATQSTLHPSYVGAFNSGTLGAKSSVETQQFNYLYLQLNPSFGYQLLNKLSVSVGGDLQKLLQTEGTERAVINAAGEARVVPGLDLGITGKTEYAITPKLRAGVLYREGVNNVFYSGDNYAERRYMQVQLKLTILDK